MSIWVFAAALAGWSLFSAVLAWIVGRIFTLGGWQPDDQPEWRGRRDERAVASRLRPRTGLVAPSTIDPPRKAKA